MGDVRVWRPLPPLEDGRVVKEAFAYVNTADLAAWLATDAGRAAIRAGVRAELRAELETIRDDVRKADLDTALRWAVERLSAAPREPAQDEPAAGVGISQDARRALADQIHAYFRDHRVHDLDSDDHDWLEAKIDAALTPPTAPQPAQEPAAGVGPSKQWCEQAARKEGAQDATTGKPVEYGWVIERGDSDVCSPTYWAGPDRWSQDHLDAVRFSRKHDAERVACRLDQGYHRVAEHGWINLTPPTAPQPAQEPAAGVAQDPPDSGNDPFAAAGAAGFAEGVEAAAEIADGFLVRGPDIAAAIRSMPLPAAPDALLPGLRAARDAADELRLQGMRLALVEISSGPGDEVERDKHAAAKLRAEIARRGGA